MKGVADAMRADVGKVSISGGSAGGAEQILAGLLAKAVGANPAEVNYVAHSGGGEALSDAAVGAGRRRHLGRLARCAAQIKAGKMRALGGRPARSG